ncbi:hypothetical protein Ancab_002144 [Ancistrocladus abbreviatus]
MIEEGTTSSRRTEKVIIRPHVIQSVLNRYYCRAVTCTGNSARLVGVLLGISFSNGAIVNVTNSYAVPFQEDEDDPCLWFLDQNFHESMYSMFRRINAKEHLVGWYSTGANLLANDSEIHKLFDASVPNPILVKINVQTKEREEPTKAYYAVKDIEKPDIHVIVPDFLQGTSNLLPSLNVSNFSKATEDDLLSAEPPKDNSDATLLTIQHEPTNNGIHPMTLSSPGASAEIVPESTSKRVHEINAFTSTKIPSKRNQVSLLPESSRREANRGQGEMDLEFQFNALRNARSKVMVVAVLIATLTFSAGINPPGVFNQATGKAMLSKQTSFQVFTVCNIVALFSSLAIVITFVGIIPFKPDNMKPLLMLSHKVMWFSMMSMAAAFIAAIWSTIPYAEWTGWVPVTSLAVGVGCSPSIIAGLLILKLKHRV